MHMVVGGVANGGETPPSQKPYVEPAVKAGFFVSGVA